MGRDYLHRSYSERIIRMLEVRHEEWLYVDASLPAEAAWRSRRDMLTRLHEKGCPWDARTTAAAVEKDSVECLKYALSQHCLFDVTALLGIFEESMSRSQCREE